MFAPTVPLPPPTPPRHWVIGALKAAGAGAVLLALFILSIWVRYGGGAPYPDVSGPPLLPESALEVAAVSQEPVGNVAVSSSGRLFFTLHPEGRPTGPKLLEWKDGKAVPFPDAQVQTRLFDTVLGITIDRHDRLWTIDPGHHGTRRPRLLALELATGNIAHDFVFPPDIAPPGSYLQDLRLDSKGDTVFIADVAYFRRSPALVVYDVKTQRARRVLDGHASVFPQDYIIRTPIKDMVFFGGLMPLKAGLEGLAMDPRGEWLWFAAMNHETLYRVRVADLLDASLDEAELERRVQAVGRKPLSDGLSADVEGNVLVTDIEHGAVLRMAPDGTLRTLVKSSRIRWPSSAAYGPDGWLYVSDSAIPHVVYESREHVAANAPYTIWRFKPGIGGMAGL